jgi:hypothetical protein
MVFAHLFSFSLVRRLLRITRSGRKESLAAGRWGVAVDAGARFDWASFHTQREVAAGFRYPKAHAVVADPLASDSRKSDFYNLYRFSDGRPIGFAFQSGKAYGQARRVVAPANDLAITYLGIAAACQLISRRPHAGS